MVEWFADHVASQLNDRLLHYSQRQMILKTAERLGISRFHANLVIAVTQHQADSRVAPVREQRTDWIPTVAIVAVVATVQGIIAMGAWYLFSGV